jgi:signal transduction histidine kinase
VNDILDFNRLKSGNFRIIKQDFSPKALLEDSIKLFEFQAQRKNLSISLMMDPLIPSVGYSDPNRIQQILLNLLSNAVK